MISTKDGQQVLSSPLERSANTFAGVYGGSLPRNYLGAKKQVLDTLQEHLINMQNKHLELQDKHLELQDKYLSVLSDPVLPIEEEVILEDQTATEPPTMQSVPVKIGGFGICPSHHSTILLFQLFQR